MNIRNKNILRISALGILFWATAGWSEGFSGNVSLEGKFFFEEPPAQNKINDQIPPTKNKQHRVYGSISAEPQYSAVFSNGNQIFDARIFARYDIHDENRTAGDIRELSFVQAADTWELRFGFRKVFWGVTESAHLVDVVNQSDFVQNPNGEKKLGQPMINFALITSDLGSFDFFVMSGFRKRTFPGREGRPRIALDIRTDENDRLPIPTEDGSALFESDLGIWQPDGAFRWSHSVGAFDIGASYFYGTSREPYFVLATANPLTTAPELIPRYELMHQPGLDVQATFGDWLLKYEGIYRVSDTAEFYATAFGFEYTIYGLIGTADLGLILEYLYDERGSDFPAVNFTPHSSGEFRTEPVSFSAFESDFFVGTRFSFNDTQSTELLAGGIIDADTQATSLLVEGTRRLGESFKMTLEMSAVVNADKDDFVVYSQRNDASVTLELGYYF